MAGPSSTVDQNLLPVQAYFDVYGNFQTFIGQGQPFFAIINPYQTGLHITNSTIDSTTIGAITPSTGSFTNMTTITGQVTSTPVNPNDLTNKSYVDAVIQGLSFKAPAQVTTTANITLSGLQTIDGYTTVAGDRVLVRNQTLTQNNGIYNASATAWTRSSDADTYAELVAAFIFIENGTIYTGSAWVSTIPATGTLGTTPITFTQFSNTALYNAGTGLTLSGYTFSITPVGTAGTYGSASAVPVLTTNASGQVTSVTNTSIAIAGSQITSGTIGTSYLTGSYTGITGVGTLTAGTWNASTIGVAYGGTGATTLTGYLLGNGTGAVTASSTIPTTALSGTVTNAQLANSTISGVALGGSLFSLTAGTAITFSSGTTYNGSAAITINATVPAQVYPGAGIANSTGTAWGTSYTTTGSGTVVALATSPSLVTPVLGTPTSGNFSTGTFTWPTFNQNTSGTASNVTGTVVVGNGGTGVTTLTGLAYGNGTSAFTAATAAQVVTVIGATAVTNATNATTATNATNTAITDNTSSSATWYPTHVSSTTGNLPQTTSSTAMSFVPSTGILTCTGFAGAGTGLTGTATSLSVGGNAATVTTVTQTNIAGAVTPGTSGNVLTSNGTAWTSAVKTITSGTAVASTSGTSIDFTSIPSWVKRITINFSNVRSSGVANWQIQLGTSSGIQTTNYLGSYVYTGIASSGGSPTTGFVIYHDTASNIRNGSVVINLLGSNTWSGTGALGDSTASYMFFTAYSVALAATLDRVRITTTNGTDTFNLGTINILYE